MLLWTVYRCLNRPRQAIGLTRRRDRDIRFACWLLVVSRVPRVERFQLLCLDCRAPFSYGAISAFCFARRLPCSQLSRQRFLFTLASIPLDATPWFFQRTAWRPFAARGPLLRFLFDRPVKLLTRQTTASRMTMYGAGGHSRLLCSPVDEEEKERVVVRPVIVVGANRWSRFPFLFLVEIGCAALTCKVSTISLECRVLIHRNVCGNMTHYAY